MTQAICSSVATSSLENYIRSYRKKTFQRGRGEDMHIWTNIGIFMFEYIRNTTERIVQKDVKTSKPQEIMDQSPLLTANCGISGRWDHEFGFN